MPRRRNKIRQKHVPDVVFCLMAVGGGTVSWYHFAMMVSRLRVCMFWGRSSNPRTGKRTEKNKQKQKIHTEFAPYPLHSRRMAATPMAFP